MATVKTFPIKVNLTRPHLAIIPKADSIVIFLVSFAARWRVA